MCNARNRLASSMKGRFSVSDKVFHSEPSLLEISELCILGFSCAIFRLWPRDHTMNAFIGRLTRSGLFLSSGAMLLLPCPCGPCPNIEPFMLLLCGGVGDGPPPPDPVDNVGEFCGSWV